MKRHCSTTRRASDTITGIAEATAERVRLGGELLQALAIAVAENEKAQRRFRTAVLIRLSRIETVVTMIHGAQIAESHSSQPHYEEKAREHAQDAEKYISQHSQVMGLKMVRYIYGEEEEAASPRRGRRRIWSSWEI